MWSEVLENNRKMLLQVCVRNLHLHYNLYILNHEAGANLKGYNEEISRIMEILLRSLATK